MNRLFTRALLAMSCCILTGLAALPLSADEPEFETEPKLETLFNGTDLEGWKGLDSHWSVKDGSIVGQTSADNPVAANTFLIWQGGEVEDFEFTCKVRFEGVNSGVQYRSKLVNEKKLALAGYQADLHPRADYMGMMYGERTGRGIIATGGQRIVIAADGKKEVTDRLVPLGELPAGQWNELRIVAVGNRMIHQINGTTTVDVTDDHPKSSRSGLLGLQLHQGPPMKADFRELKLRKLNEDNAAKVLTAAIEATNLAPAETSDASAE